MIPNIKRRALSTQGLELLCDPYIYSKLLIISSAIGVTPEEYLIRFEEVLSDTHEKILEIFEKP